MQVVTYQKYELPQQQLGSPLEKGDNVQKKHYKRNDTELMPTIVQTQLRRVYSFLSNSTTKSFSGSETEHTPLPTIALQKQLLKNFHSKDPL